MPCFDSPCTSLTTLTRRRSPCHDGRFPPLRWQGTLSASEIENNFSARLADTKADSKAGGSNGPAPAEAARLIEGDLIERLKRELTAAVADEVCARLSVQISADIARGLERMARQQQQEPGMARRVEQPGISGLSGGGERLEQAEGGGGGGGRRDGHGGEGGDAQQPLSPTSNLWQHSALLRRASERASRESLGSAASPGF